MASLSQIDLQQIIPDITFDLQVSSPQKLLDRLDVHDPKFIFRSRNIKGGFRPGEIASRHLPEYVEENVVRIDAEESPEDIHKRIVSCLGAVSLFETSQSTL